MDRGFIEKFLGDLKEREWQQTILQYAIAALVFFGVIDLESLDAVQEIMVAATKNAEATTEGVNKLLGLAAAFGNTGIFTIGRSIAKRGA